MSINAYGAGNDYAPDAYNVPGMNTSELAALQQNKFSTYLAPMSQTTPDSAYSTPGVGNNQRSLADAIAASLTNGGQNSLLSSSVIQIVSNLLLDSNVLASAVNSVNLAQSQRYGPLADNTNGRGLFTEAPPVFFFKCKCSSGATNTGLRRAACTPHDLNARFRRLNRSD